MREHRGFCCECTENAGCVVTGCTGDDCPCLAKHPQTHTRTPVRPGDPGFRGLTGKQVSEIATLALLEADLKEDD